MIGPVWRPPACISNSREGERFSVRGSTAVPFGAVGAGVRQGPASPWLHLLGYHAAFGIWFARTEGSSSRSFRWAHGEAHHAGLAPWLFHNREFLFSTHSRPFVAAQRSSQLGASKQRRTTSSTVRAMRTRAEPSRFGCRLPACSHPGSHSHAATTSSVRRSASTQNSGTSGNLAARR